MTEIVPRRPTVVAAIPIKRRARERLSELLGARVLDIRAPVDHPDMVLTPACSPQLVGALKARFNGAPVIIVELTDDEFDIELTGPVTRVLDGGADAYLLAGSLDDLARKLAATRTAAATAEPERIAKELDTPTMDDLIAAFLHESVQYAQRQPRD